MAQLKIKIGGAWTWINAIMVDANNKKTSISLDGASPVSKTVDVDPPAYARLVVHASGNPGDAITADILKNGKSICFERTWPFDAHGHVDEVIVFDPDSQPIDGGDDA